MGLVNVSTPRTPYPRHPPRMLCFRPGLCGLDGFAQVEHTYNEKNILFCTQNHFIARMTDYFADKKSESHQPSPLCPLLDEWRHGPGRFVPSGSGAARACAWYTTAPLRPVRCGPPLEVGGEGGVSARARSRAKPTGSTPTGSTPTTAAAFSCGRASAASHQSCSGASRTPPPPHAPTLPSLQPRAQASTWCSSLSTAGRCT